MVKLRDWNPGRNEPREKREEPDDAGDSACRKSLDICEVSPSARQHTLASEAIAARGDRPVTPHEAGSTTGLHVPRRSHRRDHRPGLGRIAGPWNNPIIWRELKTRAYGSQAPASLRGPTCSSMSPLARRYFLRAVRRPWRWTAGRRAKAMIPLALAVLSLVLVNAQGVTALTSERDSGRPRPAARHRAQSPKEFIYGKLYGVLYNTKEMIALPIALFTIWLGAVRRDMSAEKTVVFVVVDFLLLVHFSAMLGLHAAITYTNSRTAVANSLGTIFFLMVGIGLCAFLIILSEPRIRASAPELPRSSSVSAASRSTDRSARRTPRRPSSWSRC